MGLPVYVARAEQRCACQQTNDLCQVNAWEQDKEEGSEPASSARYTQDAARAAIMGQALQASSIKHHTTLNSCSVSAGC